jgi:hypothetical protein
VREQRKKGKRRGGKDARSRRRRMAGETELAKDYDHASQWCE